MKIWGMIAFILYSSTYAKQISLERDTLIATKPKNKEYNFYATTIPIYLSMSRINFNFLKQVDKKWGIGFHYLSFKEKWPGSYGLLEGGIIYGETKWYNYGLSYEYHFSEDFFSDSYYLTGSLTLVRAVGNVFLEAGTDSEKLDSETEYMVLPGASWGYSWLWNQVNLKLGLGLSVWAPIVDFKVGVIF